NNARRRFFVRGRTVPGTAAVLSIQKILYKGEHTMSLTAPQITQVYEILGIPQDGSGEVFASLATLFGPAFDSYDMSAIVVKIDSKLSGLSDERVDRVTA